MPQATAIKDKIPKPLIALILVASILVVSGAISFYQIQKEKVLTRTYDELEIVTTLKAEEVKKWRQEHIRDGSIISGFLPINKLMFSILGNKNDINVINDVQQKLLLFLADYDYQSVVIIDEKGRIRLIYPSSSSTNIRFLPVQEFKSNDLDFSDLHYSDDMVGLHIDMLIPIIPPDSIVFTNSGMIILRIDPEISLFPNLKVMPTPTLPAEILLVRRDGDSVTYLNHATGLHRKFLKKSMKNRNIPAVRAAEGMEGIFEGRDYNDLPVLSYLRHIPSSPWFLVAKVDKNKALYLFYRQSILLAIIALLFILVFITTIFYVWRRQNIQFYKELSITKDRFVSIMSHDLTNPFVSIAGFSELLSDELKKENYTDAIKFAEIIHDSSLSATDLIRNLSQWSRIQTNQIRLNLGEANLTSLINESVDLMKAYADKKNIKIHKNIPAELQVCVDKEMISTVFRNLISNAIKFSRPGGEIHIIAYKKKNEVTAEIVDNGIGINRDILSSIFKAENKTSTPGTLSETGTGLGLNLCKEFIEIHGGTINVESKEGYGSKFSFTIPDAS